MLEDQRRVLEDQRRVLEDQRRVLEYHRVDIDNIYQMLDETLPFDCHERCPRREVQRCAEELAGKVEELHNTRRRSSELAVFGVRHRRTRLTVLKTPCQ